MSWGIFKRKSLNLEKVHLDVAKPVVLEEKKEEQELKDRLIAEHQKANRQAIEKISQEAPMVNSNLIAAMGDAMRILKGA